MALRWLEGFEGQRQETILGRLYATFTGAIATVTGHRGNNSGINSVDLLMRSVDLLDGAADQNTWVLGWAMRMNGAGLSASATTFPYISLRSSAGEQLRVEFVAFNESKPGGNRYKLRVMRGATTLATTVESFEGANTDSNWTYFEFEAAVRTSTNGSFSLRFHDRYRKNITVTWTAANTGINTANQGADGADRFELSLIQAAATANIAVDDMYVLDGSGSVNNGKIGEVEIEAIDVSGDGATLGWDLQGGAASLEDAWNEVSTVQSATEDDKRVSSSSPADIELAALANPALIRNVTVVGVQTRLTGKMEASGSRNVQFFYRKTTGTPAQVGTKIVTFSNTSPISHADTRETDPNTSAAWAVADIDGLQVGAELDA